MLLKREPLSPRVPAMYTGLPEPRNARSMGPTRTRGMRDEAARQKPEPPAGIAGGRRLVARHPVQLRRRLRTAALPARGGHIHEGHRLSMLRPARGGGVA